MLEKLKLRISKLNIQERWAHKVLSFVILAFLLVFITAALTLRSTYYNTIENVLSNAAQTSVKNYFNVYLDKETVFSDVALDFIEGYTQKDKFEVWAINSNGDIVASTSGFQAEHKNKLADYDEALVSESGTGVSITYLQSGEKIMAYTQIIRGASPSQSGAIRFITSLKYVDRQLALITVYIFVAMLFLMSVVLLTNHRFLKSIVKPVKKLSTAAKDFARGDYSVRIEKDNDDELGDLCDSINKMANDISVTDSMKNDFISTVSHELRTPLTSIKGWGETLINDQMSDPQLTHRGLQVIINESGRLAGFVEELLDFSRMQNGKLSLHMEMIDVLAELDETVFIFKERAMREGIEIQYSVPDIPAPMMGDANRIKQVFVNILDNAIKYNNEGGKVYVVAEIEKEKIKITFADNGCGISEKDLPHVKEKFYKANISVKGSGIGLAVADEIVNIHKGTLDIQSVENEGTTITITLPLTTNFNNDKEN